MKSIITKFFKAVWLKYYNFIQWTKKWHFCHFFIWSAWVGILFLYLLFLAFLILFPRDPKGSLLEFIEGSVLALMMSSYYLLIVTVPVAIIKMIISFFKNKNVFVTSEFLISNKKYDIAYILTFSSLIIVWLCATQIEDLDLFIVPFNQFFTF